MRTITPAAVALAATLAATASAQVSTIVQATGTEATQSSLSQQASVTASSDGRLWTIVYFNDGKGQGANSQFNRIYASKDNGKSWQLATSVRTTGAVRGSVAIGNDGRTLHVVWQASNGGAGASVWYAAWNTVAAKWLAADLNLAKGTSSNSQFLSPHVTVTPKGRVVVSYHTHRQGPWAGRMRIREGKTWLAEQKVNRDTYGIWIDAQVNGEDVWFAYRTNSGLYGIRARRYDTESKKWGAEGEMQISQLNTQKAGTASSENSIGVLPTGDAYVAYATGNRTAGKGAIWVGLAKAGTYKFTTHLKVADDGPLLGGNHNYYNYTLSRNADSRIYVLYSLASEQNAKLYMRWLIGSTLGPKLTLATGKAKQFSWLAGQRSARGRLARMATITDLGTPRRVLWYGSQSAGIVTPHGMGCSGKLQVAPALATSNLPQLGQNVAVTLADMPKTTPAILFLGLSDTRLGVIPLPLDLSIIGMQGCRLSQDFFVTLGYASDAQGKASLPVPIPNLAVLAGVPLYFQSFVIARGANATGAIVSNGISAIPR